MAQSFTIMYMGHLYSDPYKAFVWSEDDDGVEKYGFLYSSSVSGCLTQIEKELYEEEFEINIDVGEKHGGNSVVTSLEELAAAKLKYNLLINIKP